MAAFAFSNVACVISCLLRLYWTDGFQNMYWKIYWNWPSNQPTDRLNIRVCYTPIYWLISLSKRYTFQSDDIYLPFINIKSMSSCHWDTSSKQLLKHLKLMIFFKFHFMETVFILFRNCWMRNFIYHAIQKFWQNLDFSQIETSYLLSWNKQTNDFQDLDPRSNELNLISVEFTLRFLYAEANTFFSYKIFVFF